MTNCGPAPLTLRQNTLIKADGNATTAQAIVSEGRCVATIAANTEIRATTERSAGRASGITCQAFEGMAAACTISANTRVEADAARGGGVAVGIDCQAHSCRRISRNRRIAGGEAEETFGVRLVSEGTLLDRNQVVGGCGRRLSVGLWLENAYAQLENNAILGAECQQSSDDDTESVSHGVRVVSSGQSAGTIFSTNNVIDGGESPSEDCQSTGLSWVTMGPMQPQKISSDALGRWQNNIISSGSCDEGIVVNIENTGTPRSFEHNLLWPRDEADLFRIGEMTLTRDTLNAQDFAKQNRVGNPNFIDWPIDLRIQLDSPAVDAGKKADAPAVDAFGQVRGDKVDIGWHEAMP
jgi:hypothetical protein